jgi:predicted dehydrogenase
MDAMEPIRIGVIGAGGITKFRHLPGLKKIENIQFVAVCNRSEASSSAVAKDWGFERIEATPEKIIQAKDIHAIVVGTWPYMHQPLCCAALRAGKHVFTQARMARNLKEAKLMLAAAKKHPKLVAMICPSPFAMKGTLLVQKLLKEGFVGKIHLVRFHHHNASVSNPAAPIHWRQQSEFNGLNTLSYGIMVERLLQWFGPIESVIAKGSIFTPKRKNEQGKLVSVTVFDQLQVIAQLRDHPGTMNLSFSGAVHHSPTERAEIYGDQGTLIIDFSTNDILGAKASEKSLQAIPIPPELETQWNVEADFIDAIRAGGVKRLPPERTRFFSPDFQEGVRYMAVTEATILSAKTGRKVKVAR